MRQIAKNIFSAVKDYYFQYSAKFFHLHTQKTYSTYKLLILIAFCTASFVAKAQVAVKASFSTLDYQGCVPVKIQFTDNSTGSPAYWFWDFGDGHISTLPNPANTYTVPGTYKVKMVVKNSVSVDSAFQDVVINGAKADFDYTYTDICTTPSSINFSARNPRFDVIYHWDLGDTHKAIIPNPSNTYERAGKYNVRLTTISPEGCEDSILKVIQVGGSTVNFSAPTTICANEYVTFINSSTPQPLSATWLVNNVVVQQDTGNLTYQFKSPGTYTIQLRENFGSCDNSLTKQVQVLDNPSASFSLSGTLKSCAYPQTVQFTNTSSNAIAFKWYFGDGDSSIEVSPAHIYKAGNFSPTLVAYNANGCSDTIVQTNAIFLGGASIDGFNLPGYGCVPYYASFDANISSPEAIASYSWDFGDSTTDVVAQPTHIYTEPGIYNVTLTVTTVSGCTTTSIVNRAISVGTHSIPDFTADKSTVCGSDSVHFSGTASGPVTNWHWIFNFNTNSFDQNPSYAFRDTGHNIVKLIVNNNGCLDSVLKQDFVAVDPPIAFYRPRYFCDDRAKIQFTDYSIGTGTWLWNFGDSTTSTEQNPPLHSYLNDGVYFTSLTTSNADGTCTNTYTDTIYINTRKPVFTFSPANGIVCRKADIELGVDNPFYILDYLWDLGDGRTLFSDTSIHTIYYKAGVYYPSLIARYRNGCQDTLLSPDPITVTGPTASFKTALPAVCLNDTTVFIDNSFSDGQHPIVSRVWSYGDDVSESKNDPPYTHVYTGSGLFTAMLSIADSNNCVDTARYNVIVNALPVVFAGLDTFVCEGSSVQLQPSGALSYFWKREQTLSCFNCPNPEASPTVSSTYMVTGTDASSCRASDTVLVTVIHPFTMTVDKTPRDICETDHTDLSASGADLYTWSPAEGLSDPNIGNPTAKPVSTTTYTVTGTDSKKCFSQTDSVLVNVHPNPKVTIPNNELEVQKGSRNIINTTGSDNITKWYWYPSLGLSCTDCPQPVLEAQQSMTYNAVVYADFGCTDTAQLTVHVLCDQSKIFIPSAFTPNGDGINDRFYVQSSIDNPIRSFVIYNRAGEAIFNKESDVTNYSSAGWDGTYRGTPMPPGTYIYRVEVLCNNKVVPLIGTVTLIR